MFEDLFATTGLSIDRLRVLVAVGAVGSIVKAADGDPVRQSQYSRQIKELEDHFQVKLVERHGRGIRLTSTGRELARISRFFMMGLSNFKRGCLAREQHYRIGSGATFLQEKLTSIIPCLRLARTTFATEVLPDSEIERRLHDLTLDFGIVGRSSLSRPLQTRLISSYSLLVAVPRALHRNAARAQAAFESKSLPLAIPQGEIPTTVQYEARLLCSSFLDALAALKTLRLAAILPSTCTRTLPVKEFLTFPLPGNNSCDLYFAWNPRLLRLNPHAVRASQTLLRSLAPEEGNPDRKRALP